MINLNNLDDNVTNKKNYKMFVTSKQIFESSRGKKKCLNFRPPRNNKAF